MEFNLRLRKVCPSCNTLVCGCGHAFASKRKAKCTTNESVRRERASESEKETDKVRRARRRAEFYTYMTLAFPKIMIPLIICTTDVHAEGLHFIFFKQAGPETEGPISGPISATTGGNENCR